MCKTLSNFKHVYRVDIPRTSDMHGVAPYLAAFQCANEECAVIIGGIATGDNVVVKTWPEFIATKHIEDVPDQIARAAEEAHLDLAHGCYRSAAILSRAVVEATAKAKGITTGNLVSKIDEMHKQGLIRELIRDAAHEIRHYANNMAHGDFVDPVAKEEAEEVVSFMDEVLEEVFQMPERLGRRKAARLATKAGTTTP